MRAAENFVSTGRPLAALCAALLLAGCPTPREMADEPLDTAYLTPLPAREKVVFHVFFARYNALENDLMGEVWAEAESPAAEIDKLWRENGLRIAAADEKAAERIRGILKRSSTFRIISRQMVMWGLRPFDIVIGRRIPSTGLVYRTGKAKAFRDVTDLQFFLDVFVLGRGRDSRISLTACFSEGADVRREIRLEGGRVTYDFAEGMMIVIGACADPPEMSLAEGFYTDDETGRAAALVMIEPKLTY